MSYRISTWNLRCILVALILVVLPAHGSQWIPVGPDGGEVRSLNCDPKSPDHLYLGTANGEIFSSQDGGRTWNRLAHLANRDDYSLDHIVVDANNSKLIFVSAWSRDSQGGEVFRSKNGGKDWESLPGMHDKAVRALAISNDSRVLLAGAGDGVFRSNDQGKSWEKISPDDHPSIRNVQSLAFDPANTNIVYAGTSRQTWRTKDGGSNWELLKKGIPDLSNVLSIIVDKHNGLFVVAGSASGIYRSETAGDSFKKVQNASVNRGAHVLKQDPANAQIIYAGTGEGLWKSADFGREWKRITGGDIVVNDVLVDPRNSQRVLIATDMGVLASGDGGKTFSGSNQGFSHRAIGAIRVDRNNSQVIFAGLKNDHEAGGVFISRDGGMHWQQNSNGLHGYDVVALNQASNGSWLAGTSHGMFLLEKNSNAWRPSNTIVTEHGTPRLINVNGRARRVMAHNTARGVLQAQVNDIEIEPNRWIAATSVGLFSSSDQGKLWSGGPVLGKQDFAFVKAEREFVVATTRSTVMISLDGGTDWKESSLHQWASAIYGLVVLPNATIYVATREGLFHSGDAGVTWDRVNNGIPGRNIDAISFDAPVNRLLASNAGNVYESTDKGRSWHRSAETGYAIQCITAISGRVFAATSYDGVVIEPPDQIVSTRK